MNRILFKIHQGFRLPRVDVLPLLCFKPLDLQLGTVAEWSKALPC